MDELLPIGAGLLLGILFALRLRPLDPAWVKALLILAAGAAATVSSGEYLASWGFLIVDIGEVALCAWIAHTALRYLASRAGWTRLMRK